MAATATLQGARMDGYRDRKDRQPWEDILE